MGEILKTQCTKCEYKMEFFVGAGMLYDRIEVVKPLFIGSAAEKLAPLLKQGGHMGFIANSLLAVCDRCNGLSTMPTVTVYLNEGGTLKVSNPCTCGGNLAPVDYQGGDVSCPSCKASLDILEDGHWD